MRRIVDLLDRWHESDWFPITSMLAPLAIVAIIAVPVILFGY